MPKYKDITGQKFSRLTAMCLDHRNIHGQALWRFVCDCGNECVISMQDVKSGHTKSCGCYDKERAKFKRRTHGMSKTPVWNVWINMIRRCTEPKNNSYADYGSRGISVCNRWSTSFKNFYDDMGQIPVAGMELDRKDNSLGYFKENCQWVTEIDQANNKRSTRIISINGGSVPLAVWCRKNGLNYKAAYHRIITLGRDPENTISELQSYQKKPASVV